MTCGPVIKGAVLWTQTDMRFGFITERCGRGCSGFSKLRDWGRRWSTFKLKARNNAKDRRTPGSGVIDEQLSGGLKVDTGGRQKTFSLAACTCGTRGKLKEPRLIGGDEGHTVGGQLEAADGPLSSSARLSLH